MLEVLALGDDYALEHEGDLTRIQDSDGTVHLFDTFIDARGQKALGAGDLPFPALRKSLDVDGPVRMSADFAVEGVGQGWVFLPAAPFLLHRMPFAQGITASHDMAETVAAAILRVG